MTASTGWALAGKQILRTSNGGLSWTDISPKLTGEQAIDRVHFLDLDHGWAVVHAGGATELPVIWVAATTDGGKTWSMAAFPASTFLLQSYANTANLSFVDEAHGWALMDLTSSAAASRGSLFATADGGNTWAALPDPPIRGDIQFFSDGTGYLVGGVHQDELYRTRDGGHSWLRIVVPVPDQVHAYVAENGYVTHPVYQRPSFETPEHGIIAILVHVTEMTDNLLTYTTNDAGENWQLQNKESNLHGVGPLAFYDSTYVEVRKEGGR